jgi:sulfide:quinone oxidoreductase
MDSSFDIVIVGAGAGGLAATSSLRKRNKNIRIAVVDPSETHDYQPGWTMVGGGIFDQQSTRRSMHSLIPSGVTWVRSAVTTFIPEASSIELDNGDRLSYSQLVVAAGLKLDFAAIPGLEETLGKNGVTSNYRYDLAPYTWDLVKNLKNGQAIFTQPPMPIKCAGAPQKAMYLSGDHWFRTGALQNINIEFCTSTPGLFGVADYVPALMQYVEKYRAKLNFQHTLTAVDGASKTATFTDSEGNEVVKQFDLLHVCPPQKAPEFIAASPLADESGWLQVDQHTLQHTRYDNIWGLGDCTNTPNAKTAAAARAQAPIVAMNVIAALGLGTQKAQYNGYGSCPLTVERGKIVLAEFGYGGKIIPSLPTALLNGKRPTRAAWFLKAVMLPWIYWNAMLKGREWLIKTEAQV